MKRTLVAGLLITAGVLVNGWTHAADRVKVGLLTTLSGPGAAIGIDLRDGFDLFLKGSGGRLGGVPAELLVADDQLSPDVGRQAVDRLLRRDRVDFMTGIAFSSVMLPVLPAIIESRTFYISSNAGPRDYAGERCSPYFFAVAWQNEDIPFAMGRFIAGRGFSKVAYVAPNFPGGREVLDGFRRGYPGKIEETFTKLGQLDYAAELASIRAARPDALFMFLPGAMGISFIKQFVASGMSKDIQIFVPGYSADEDSLKPLGTTLLGAFNASQWAHDLDNPQNRRFVEAFRKEFKRTPTMYAAQSYDSALLIDSAVRDVRGKLDDKRAVQRALEAGKFASVRGAFRFNRNHYPIHDIHMRVVVQDANGGVTNRTLGVAVSQITDPFASKCSMTVAR